MATRRRTTRSSTRARLWAERSARTSRRSSPTVSATASGWPSTRCPATVGAGERGRHFSELNLVEPGFNGGWIQIMGPVDRIAEFKGVEPDDVDRLLGTVTSACSRSGGPNEHRRLTRPGPVPAVHAARRALQRSGVQLEVRGRPGGHRLRGQHGPGSPVQRRPVHGRRPPSSRAGTCSTSTSPQPREDRRG